MLNQAYIFPIIVPLPEEFGQKRGCQRRILEVEKPSKVYKNQPWARTQIIKEIVQKERIQSLCLF